MFEKLEATKKEIEDKFPADESTDDYVNETEDLMLSPTSKLVRRYEEKLAREITRPNRDSKLRKEMKQYESFTNPGKTVNVLSWWKNHESILQNLANVAKKVLGIHASSAKSERVFSTGGNIVTAKRNRLAPRKVENLIVIKENMEKIDDFIKNGAYEINKLNKESAFKKITVEEITVAEDLNMSDMFMDLDSEDDEEIFFLNDDNDNTDEEEESDEDPDDPVNMAFILDD